MQRKWIITLAVAIVVVAGGAALLTQNAACCAAQTASAVQDIAPAQYQQQFAQAAAPHLLLDVRTPEEFNSGHIPGAVNISVETLADRLSEVPRDQPVVVYCRSGNRSATAAQILAEAGYADVYDLGGITTWAAQGLPVE